MKLFLPFMAFEIIDHLVELGSNLRTRLFSSL